MSIILSLPEVLVEIILSEWIHWRDFLHFDSSLCNKQSRLQFLSFLKHFRKGSVWYLAIPSQDLHLQQRNGFSAFLDIVNYCEKRKVRFSGLTLKEKDEIIDISEEPNVFALFFNGVESLKIVFETSLITDTMYFIEKIASFRYFASVQRLEIKCMHDFVLQFDTLFEALNNSWSNLIQIHIDVPSGKFSNYDRSRVPLGITKIRNDGIEESAIIPININHSTEKNGLYNIFSRLIELNLSNIHLDVIYVYKIFLAMGLPVAETIVLSSKSTNWSSKYGGTRFNPYSKIHLLSKILEKRCNGNNSNTVIYNEDDSSDEDEYQEVHGGSVSNPIRIRVYARPRKFICVERSRVRDFDDFCQLFEQSAENPSLPHILLNHLKQISGNYVYVYPLLPLMGASLSHLSLTLHPSQSDFEARTAEADSIHGKIFHNLSGLQHLSFNIDGDMSHPLNKWNFASILSGAMLSLQTITIILCNSGSIKNIDKYFLPSWIQTMSSVTRRIYFPTLYKIEFKLIINEHELLPVSGNTSIAIIYDILHRMKKIAPNLRTFVWDDENIAESFFSVSS